MLTKHSHMLIKMKTKERFYHKLKQKHSRMSCPSIFPTQNLNFWRFCVCMHMYVCMYRHIFHVSAHVAGDQTLASCLPQLLFTSFWDRISPWTWSSLTRQDQQARKPQIHLRNPRITDWRCTATPGFLQECWGLGSKHHISPALLPTLKWEAFGHHTQNCAAFYLPIAVYSIQPKKRNSQFTLNKGVSPVVLSTTGVRYLFVWGGGGQERGAPCSTGCLVMGSPQVGSVSTTPSSN